MSRVDNDARIACTLSEASLAALLWVLTLLMARKAEVAVPSWNEYHIVREILALNFGFLEHHNIGFEYVEHSLSG